MSLLLRPGSIIVQLGPSPSQKKKNLFFEQSRTLGSPSKPPPPPPKTVKEVPGKLEA